MRSLQRLFSILLIGGAFATVFRAGQLQTIILQLTALGTGVLLIAGLWTPIAGILVVLVELCLALSRLTGIENSVLLASLGAALAVLGPGSHSVDAKLYGRKRIDIRQD